MTIEYLVYLFLTESHGHPPTGRSLSSKSSTRRDTCRHLSVSAGPTNRRAEAVTAVEGWGRRGPSVFGRPSQRVPSLGVTCRLEGTPLYGDRRIFHDLSLTQGSWEVVRPPVGLTSPVSYVSTLTTDPVPLLGLQGWLSSTRVKFIFKDPILHPPYPSLY